MQDLTTPHISTRKKINFIDLVRPEFPLPWDQAFEVYRWMISTAIAYQSHRERWGEIYGYDAIALLNANPTAVGSSKYHEPFKKDWRTDLKNRFHYALLSDYAQPEAQRWRSDHKIALDESRILPIRYYSTCHPRYLTPSFRDGQNLRGDQILDAVFSLEGETLKESYNPCHLRAKTLIEIGFSVFPSYGFTLGYGYKEDFTIPGGSRWYKDISRIEGELFYDWLHRSYREITSLLEPATR